MKKEGPTEKNCRCLSSRCSYNWNLNENLSHRSTQTWLIFPSGHFCFIFKKEEGRNLSLHPVATGAPRRVWTSLFIFPICLRETDWDNLPLILPVFWIRERCSENAILFDFVQKSRNTAGKQYKKFKQALMEPVKLILQIELDMFFSMFIFRNFFTFPQWFCFYVCFLFIFVSIFFS